MDGNGNKTDSRRARLKFFGLIAGAFFILSLEGFIMLFGLALLGIDNQTFESAMPNSALVAYLICVVATITWGIILLVKNPEKMRMFMFVTLFAGISMIILTWIIGSIWLSNLNAPPSPQVLFFDKTKQIVAIHDTQIVSSEGAPIGIHVEYAIQIPADTPSGANHWNLVVNSSGGIDPLTIEGSLEEGFNATPDASDTLIGTITPTAPSTTIVYGAYNLIPFGTVIKGKDTEGNIKYCFDSERPDLSGFGGNMNLCNPRNPRQCMVPTTTQQFYSFVQQYAENITTTVGIFLESDVWKSNGIQTSTQNAYNITSFFNNIEEGPKCSTAS
jgi:hypothetical protein